MNNGFNLQPELKNEKVILSPLKAGDFEELYKVASDPLIWEQHPNKDRYKREVFEVFFKGAMESGGAFMIRDAKSGEAIGSTRFYGYDPKKDEVSIGYTFYARSHWGGKFNPAAKLLMIQHAFQYVNKILFHIGANNIRSQIAITRLGAVKIKEEEIAYYGETPKLNFVYEIKNLKSKGCGSNLVR